MSTIQFTQHNDEVHTVDATDGDSVMQTALNHDIRGIEGECGGEMTCGTCHVYVDEGWFGRLDTPSESEQELLDVMEEPRPTSRLSCQIHVSEKLDGLRVTVADE